MPRRSALVAALVIAVSGCSSSSDPTTTPLPPTTVAPTTSAAATTTATPPPVAFTSDGADASIDALVEALYRHLIEGAPAPPMPEGLAAHLDGATAPRSAIQARTILSPLKYGQAVAVVRVGDDAVLLADETAGWQIVGADLPSAGLEPWFGPSRRSVLIVGSDARWDESVPDARSDSLHVLTTNGNGAAIVGIPRDSWVTTPSGRNGKITDILANHGPEGTFETVQNVSGQTLEGWIMTGFLGFEQLASAFGSFEIDLPFRVPGSAGLPGFPAGEQVIDPPEDLLALARIRKTLPNGDFSRSFNHGVIMQAALRSVQERGMDALPALITILDDSSLTSFLAGDLLSLGATALLLDPDLVVNEVIPGSVGATSGGASIVRIGAGADAVFADQADDGLLNDSTG